LLVLAILEAVLERIQQRPITVFRLIGVMNDQQLRSVSEPTYFNSSSLGRRVIDEPNRPKAGIDGTVVPGRKLGDEVIRRTKAEKLFDPLRVGIEAEDRTGALNRDAVERRRTSLANAKLKDRSAGSQDGLAEDRAMCFVTAIDSSEEVPDPAFDEVHGLLLMARPDDRRAR
jgi:hypothetical protein